MGNLSVILFATILVPPLTLWAVKQFSHYKNTPDAASGFRSPRERHKSVSVFVLILILIVAAAAASAAAAAAIPRLAVLDIELTGDVGGPQLKAKHETRLRMASERLRRELASSGLYQVVDNAAGQALIDEIKSQQRYLHDCNGCDLDVGKRLGADEVLVAWVDRVSNLILSLTYEIDDVKTGQIDDRKSYDFRGDNDAAWVHAIDFMVQDMKERGTAHAKSP